MSWRCSFGATTLSRKCALTECFCFIFHVCFRSLKVFRWDHTTSSLASSMPATECSPLQEGRIATVRWGSKSFVQLLSYAYTLHCGSQGPLEWPVSCRIRIANHLGKPNPRYQRAPTAQYPWSDFQKHSSRVFGGAQGVSRRFKMDIEHHIRWNSDSFN